jgi:hypothetical protein
MTDQQQQITELRNHIKNLIKEREQYTEQNVIESINDDILYYQRQIDFLNDGNLPGKN